MEFFKLIWLGQDDSGSWGVTQTTITVRVGKSESFDSIGALHTMRYVSKRGSYRSRVTFGLSVMIREWFNALGHRVSKESFSGTLITMPQDQDVVVVLVYGSQTLLLAPAAGEPYIARAIHQVTTSHIRSPRHLDGRRTLRGKPKEFVYVYPGSQCAFERR